MLRTKIVILHAAKFFGLFRLSRKITAKGIHILCYHGFSYKDEHQFKNKLFITEAAFKQRLAKIAAMKFNVISLDQAVNQLKAGTDEVLNSLVITIDDGWQGTEDIALPLLKAHGFEWTLYVTSYYAEKQTQVMNIALQYLCWKTSEAEINLALVENSQKSMMPLVTQLDRERVANKLIRLGKALPTAHARQKFVRKVAAVLKLDSHECENERMFHIVSSESLKKMAEAGINIELHTHRHTLHGVNRQALEIEIRENRNFIYKAINREPRHFCYPGGFYDRAHLDWLHENGVASATTCKPGLNYTDTPLFELNRFLDGENISPIEFEAELSGFFELARRTRARFANSKNNLPVLGR